MADAIQNISGPNGEPVPNREAEARGYRETEAGRADTRDLVPLRNRNNGEEDTLRDPVTGFKTYAANSTKGMPHDEKFAEVAGRPSTGPTDQLWFTAYDALLRAVDSEDPADFAAVPIGPNVRLTTSDGQPPTRPFVDPQNGRGLALEGPDAPSAAVYRGVNEDRELVQDRIALVPEFPTPHLAAEIGEVYLMALARDVPVNQLQGTTSTDARVTDAMRLINEFSDYRGPVDALTEKVTPQTLFRGGNVLSQKGSSANVGELDGPYVSQFMLVGSRVDNGTPPPQLSAGSTGKAPESAGTGISLTRAGGKVLYGTLTIDQMQFEVQPGLDFVTDYDRWFQILQGVPPDDPTLTRIEQTQFTGQRKWS